MPVAGLRVGLVSARAARGLDEDEKPLLAALRCGGCEASRVEWDNLETSWASFELVLLRSTWDYAERLPEFLDWIERASSLTRVLNPPSMVRWNTDKHYLADLARAGVAVVPSQFIEPGTLPRAAIDQVLARHAHDEIVVKPAVGAGSRDAERHRRGDIGSMEAHASRLLTAQRSVLLQPYFDRVDAEGETSLIFVDGRFSHAIRKGPLLPRGGPATSTLFAREEITPRTPGTDELRLAQQAIAALPFDSPLYARVDLIRGDDCAPRLLELELTEPSLFFAQAPGAAERLATAVLQRLGAVSC